LFSFSLPTIEICICIEKGVYFFGDLMGGGVCVCVCVRQIGGRGGFLDDTSSLKDGESITVSSNSKKVR